MTAREVLQIATRGTARTVERRPGLTRGQPRDFAASGGRAAGHGSRRPRQRVDWDRGCCYTSSSIPPSIFFRWQMSVRPTLPRNRDGRRRPPSRRRRMTGQSTTSSSRTRAMTSIGSSCSPRRSSVVDGPCSGTAGFRPAGLGATSSRPTSRMRAWSWLHGPSRRSSLHGYWKKRVTGPRTACWCRCCSMKSLRRLDFASYRPRTSHPGTAPTPRPSVRSS